MWKYIISDMARITNRFLPLALIIGVLTLSLLIPINAHRVRKGARPFRIPAMTCFIICLGVILSMTFFSREAGAGHSFDLQLFSTWGINRRNNAYVIENILLFIPYGYVLAWLFRSPGRIPRAVLMGGATSLLIELLQYFTGRGFFQIDDIITNLLGALIGSLLCLLAEKIIACLKNALRSRDETERDTSLEQDNSPSEEEVR